VKHDPAGVFNYAPLQGETFERLLGAQREKLPDSVIVLDEAGGLYLRSDAVIFMLQRLGWQGLASTLAILPAALRDVLYSLVANVRFTIFGRKQELCPLVPPALKNRFLD
jgi:predicted DCC family thiol-disulfide oxidoreductase YuxK